LTSVDREMEWSRRDDGQQRLEVTRLSKTCGWRATAAAEQSGVTMLASRMEPDEPILVRRSDFSVVDGAARVATAKRLGLRYLMIEWCEGSELQAFELFLQRNNAHGRPPSAADREHGVLRILATEPLWSDRKIAAVAGSTPKWIARLRQRATGGARPGDTERRVGRDGRSRPVRPAETRQQIMKALDERPDAPLRVIARELGVSPETVRSVRNERQPAGVVDPASAASCGNLDKLTFGRNPLISKQKTWSCDRAFQSTEAGLSFLEWFESTAMKSSGFDRLEQVPLSRVYEIVDEAHSRASAWTDFARALEARTRKR